MKLQVWGTPEQCYEKILDIQRRTGAEAFNARVQLRRGCRTTSPKRTCVCSPTEVMPELKKHVPIEDQLIARAGVGQHADAAAFRLPA